MKFDVQNYNMKLRYDEDFILEKLAVLKIRRSDNNQEKFNLQVDQNTYAPFVNIRNSIEANQNRSLDKLINLLAFNIGLYNKENQKVLKDDDDMLESILSIYVFFMSKKDQTELNMLSTIARVLHNQVQLLTSPAANDFQVFNKVSSNPGNNFVDDYVQDKQDDRTYCHIDFVKLYNQINAYIQDQTMKHYYQG